MRTHTHPHAHTHAHTQTLSPEDHAKLLQFATGCSRLPAGGFRDLAPPFKLSLNLTMPTSRLPTAHTCFNTVDIVAYSRASELKRKLLFAIHEGTSGFAFA